MYGQGPEKTRRGSRKSGRGTQGGCSGLITFTPSSNYSIREISRPRVPCHPVQPNSDTYYSREVDLVQILDPFNILAVTRP